MNKIKAFIEAEAVLLVAVLLAAFTSIGGTALVLGAVPDDNGQIHACRSNDNGVVRIIDTEGQSCTESESEISWDQYNEAVGSRYGDISEPSFAGADAHGTDLSFRSLPNTNFTDTNLDGAFLSHSNLSNSTFTRTHLNANSEHINFTGASFNGADLSYASLPYSHFNDADLSGLTIASSSFTGSIFSNANLSNTSFAGVTLTGSTGLDSANLSGVTWSSVYCPDGTNSSDHDNTCTGHLTP